jgi:hypothetical protein
MYENVQIVVRQKCGRSGIANLVYPRTRGETGRRLVALRRVGGVLLPDVSF